MEDKYKKLVKNTAIFAIGEFASKVLNFIIVPLYTYVLTTEEYGRIDLFTTSIGLFVPVITLMIQEALIRFILGKEIDVNTAVSNSWFICLCGSAFTILTYPLYNLYFKDTTLSLLFCADCILCAFNGIFTHYLKSVGRNVAYSVKGILLTFVHLALNLWFLLGLKWGMYGYIYAAILSQVVGTVYLLSIGGIFKKLNFKHLSFPIIKQMLKFSIPLIPNSLMWWIMSAGDKYIINGFLGDGANGLYSLSLKIPTIISLFYSLFFQAWQMSAIEENNSEGRRIFYENIFKATNALLMLLITFITISSKVLFRIMSDSFFSAWIYVPLLSLAMALSCQSSFFGVVYTTSKKTSKAFYTTALGAAMNLFFNFILIRPLGLHGVAIGTLIGYAIVMLIRAKDARTEINMTFDFLRTMIALIIVSIQIIITILFDNNSMYIVGVISIIIIFGLYKKESVLLLGKMKKILKRN